MATAYSSLWDDEEDPAKAQQGAGAAPAPAAAQPPPTFSQLQQRGMPRPPPPSAFPPGLYVGAGGGIPPTVTNPAAYGGAGSVGGAKGGGYGEELPGVGPAINGGGRQPFAWEQPHGQPGNLPGPPPGPDVGAGGGVVPPGTGDGTTPPLDQSSLEAYLYQLLSDPTSTPSYQNAMRHIQSGVDVDASRRGLSYSSVPVGIGASAGADLAARLQGQAYDQLRGYNQDYSQLLMQLLGLS